jgi:hypothetical protein
VLSLTSFIRHPSDKWIQWTWRSIIRNVVRSLLCYRIEASTSESCNLPLVRCAWLATVFACWHSFIVSAVVRSVIDPISDEELDGFAVQFSCTIAVVLTLRFNL